ncbi:hypothetical protein ACFLZ9_00310 [Patescibacteria group bacterium]
MDKQSEWVENKHFFTIEAMKGSLLKVIAVVIARNYDEARKLLSKERPDITWNKLNTKFISSSEAGKYFSPQVVAVIDLDQIGEEK